MPYIPHTQQDTAAMLAAIGVNSIADLFDEIPADLRCRPLDLPPALTEMQVTQLLQQRTAQQPPLTCFVGAGAYQHHIPAAVWEIASRGEFYSAYTPYQAEASQGTLQLLYEFQTMMANLTGLDVSNASLYDGASALAEAVLMAVRLSKKKTKQILMPATVSPRYRQVVHTIVKNQGIELLEVPYNPTTGTIDETALPITQAAALVIPQPNFFGTLEAVDTLTDWAHSHEMLVIGLVNPLALSVLSAPGEWGTTGADIACGDAQPLGIPLSGGGPYLGFMCCKKEFVRQIPGRIVGQTVDTDGKIGYTLTLQAREQHIRRSKATSNICTNQGLMATAATIHIALLGAHGLRNTALAGHTNTQQLLEKLTEISGVQRQFSAPFFHEVVIQLARPVAEVLQLLAAQGILGGYDLTADFPELGQALLICVTEMRTETEIAEYAECLAKIVRFSDTCG